MKKRVIGNLYLLMCFGIIICMGCGGGGGSSGASSDPAPGGGIDDSFNIAGKTFTFTLGAAGDFSLQPNAMVRNVAELMPFDQTPSDTPATGAVRLRGSSITILPPNAAAKSVAPAQSSISGTARLRVAIDAPEAGSPCDSDWDLGEFEIVVTNGVVTSVGPGLPMHLAAVDYFNRNDLTICLEMTSNFEAGLRIEGLEVTFGPSQSGAGEGIRATFDRRNLEGPPIHLLAPGEDFSEDNRVWIGTPRTMAIDDLTINGLVTFRAGRDGQVLDSATCPPVRYGGYYAIVIWDGTNLDCYEPAFTPEPTEACCLPPMTGYELYDQTYAVRCLDLGSRRTFTTHEDCRWWGGVPQGAGTTCASITCDEPFSACCIENECYERLFEDCRDLGGTYQGTGSHCDSLSCDPDEVWGACCYDLGPGVYSDQCIETTYDECTDKFNGRYLGDGTTCDPNPCVTAPLTEEACCFPDGACEDGDPELCTLLGGTPQGAGTTCLTTPGACCLADGSCRLITEQECTVLRGWFQGGCALCDPNLCQNLVGACCWNSQCTLTSAADCSERAGTYMGDGTTCEPNPCPETMQYHVFKRSGLGYKKGYGGCATRMEGYDYFYQKAFPSEVDEIIAEKGNFERDNEIACQGGPWAGPAPSFPAIWANGAVELVGSFDTFEEIDPYRCQTSQYDPRSVICTTWVHDLVCPPNPKADNYWDAIDSICGLPRVW